MLFEFDQRLEIGLLIKQEKIDSGNFNLVESHFTASGFFGKVSQQTRNVSQQTGKVSQHL